LRIPFVACAPKIKTFGAMDFLVLLFLSQWPESWRRPGKIGKYTDQKNLMNFPTEFLDVKATFERYRDSNSNFISTEKFAELKLKTDVFLTHDWGIDELGRASLSKMTYRFIVKYLTM
jgi:hypothetical protein